MVKTILSFVVVLIVAASIYYCTSDVGHARIESMREAYAEWTPENIAENPDLYLDACERNAVDSLGKLKANELVVMRQSNDLRGKLSRISGNVRVAKIELEKMRSLYSDASAPWPVTWNGRSLDRDAYKAQVVYLNKDIQRQEKLAGQYTAACAKADAAPASMAQSIADLQGYLADIRVQRDMLKIQRIDSEMAEQIINIRVALDDVSGVFGGSSSAPMGVDDLSGLKTEAAGVSDEDFREAMGWKQQPKS